MYLGYRGVEGTSVILCLCRIIGSSRTLYTTTLIRRYFLILPNTIHWHCGCMKVRNWAFSLLVYLFKRQALQLAPDFLIRILNITCSTLQKSKI